MLHSKYEGVRGFARPVIAFDLFRFKGGKIVEHWGGQDPEVGPNPSGHTQVDGPIRLSLIAIGQKQIEISFVPSSKLRRSACVLIVSMNSSTVIITPNMPPKLVMGSRA